MRANKGFLIFTGCLFALGLGLTLAGLAMGGARQITEVVFTSAEQTVVAGADYGAFYVGPEGVHIGGPYGIHVDSGGVRIGGGNGLYVGPEGVRLFGMSGGRDVVVGTVVETTDVLEGDALQVTSADDLKGTSLDVDIDLGDVILEYGGEFGISLSYDQRGPAIRWTREGNTIRVYSESGKTHFTDLRGGQVSITVPAGAELEWVDLHSNLGDILVTGNGETAVTASLFTSLGNVECFGLTAEEFTAESDLGDVTVEFPQSEGVSYDLSTDLGNAVAYGGNGSTSYSASPEKYSVNLHSALGDVTLTLGNRPAGTTE